MSILEKAIVATSTDRPSVYGHPRKHFACTAAFVTAYLKRRGLLRDDAAVTPEDWTQLMALDKIARQAGSLTETGQLHMDTLVDQAGYARTAEMLTEPKPNGKANGNGADHGSNGGINISAA